MQRVIITGANGFIGRHLVNFLSTKMLDIFSFSRSHTANFQTFNIYPNDRERIASLIAMIQPNWVLHLAGSTINEQFSSNLINYEYCKNIIDGIEAANLTSTNLLVLGSAAEYGFLMPSQFPINESKHEIPFNLYGRAKLKQTNLVMDWSRNKNGRGIVLRPFTILGPGMPRHLAIGNFEYQIGSILKGQTPPIIKVGNLESKRDYIDVNDLCKIIYSSMQTPSMIGNIFNVCSGFPVKISEILHYMIEIAAINVQIMQSSDVFRGKDMKVHYGSNVKLLTHIGNFELTDWKSTIKIIINNLNSP